VFQKNESNFILLNLFKFVNIHSIFLKIAETGLSKFLAVRFHLLLSVILNLIQDPEVFARTWLIQ